MVTAEALRPFTDVRFPVSALSGDLIATDGKILLRVHQGVDVSGIPETSERVQKFVKEQLHQPENGNWIRLSDVEIKTHRCKHCEGTGYVKQCKECDGEGVVYFETGFHCYENECRSCRGTGSKRALTGNECTACIDGQVAISDFEDALSLLNAVRVGSVILRGHHLLRVRSLFPDAEVDTSKNESGIHFLRFSGGCGLIQELDYLE